MRRRFTIYSAFLAFFDIKFDCISRYQECGELEGWARKPVNHTNRKDVVCCHLIDRPQSVPQLSCNRTLQFLKILRVNRNAIYSLSSKCNAVMPLYNLNVTCKVIFARSCPRLHSRCSEWEGGPCKTGKPHQLGGRSYSN